MALLIKTCFYLRKDIKLKEAYKSMGEAIDISYPNNN